MPENVYRLDSYILISTFLSDTVKNASALAINSH